MSEWTYDNPRDLLKILLEWSKTNINVDWNDADVKAEFQEYVDVIETHLNEGEAK